MIRFPTIANDAIGLSGFVELNHSCFYILLINCLSTFIKRIISNAAMKGVKTESHEL